APILHLPSFPTRRSSRSTSMASPHVAAAAALLVSQGITNPAEVKAALQKAARPKGPAEQYGAGLLDVGAAVSRSTTLNLERPARSEEHTSELQSLAYLVC